MISGVLRLEQRPKMELLPTHNVSIEVNSMIQKIEVDRQNVVARLRLGIKASGRTRLKCICVLIGHKTPLWLWRCSTEKLIVLLSTNPNKNTQHNII